MILYVIPLFFYVLELRTEYLMALALSGMLSAGLLASSALGLQASRPALMQRSASTAVARQPPTSMQLFGRLRAKREVEMPDQIMEGAALPEIEIEALLFQLPEEGAEGSPTDVKAAVLPLPKALGNGTTVLVGMPGAFTPTCSDQHLPGFIRNTDKLKGLGVERVAVITTNDRYVNSAWNQAIEDCMVTKSGLLMLSDADGDAVKAMGLVDDMGFGLGLRSKRFVIVAEGGAVKCAAPRPCVWVCGEGAERAGKTQIGHTLVPPRPLAQARAGGPGLGAAGGDLRREGGAAALARPGGFRPRRRRRDLARRARRRRAHRARRRVRAVREQRRPVGDCAHTDPSTRGGRGRPPQ